MKKLIIGTICSLIFIINNAIAIPCIGQVSIYVKKDRSIDARISIDLFVYKTANGKHQSDKYTDFIGDGHYALGIDEDTRLLNEEGVTQVGANVTRVDGHYIDNCAIDLQSANWNQCQIYALLISKNSTGYQCQVIPEFSF